MATENQYNSFNQSNSHGQSPPPYTPRVVVTRFTSDSFNVRDKIEQLENENKKLTRQVKICRGRLGLMTTEMRAQTPRNDSFNVRDNIEQLQSENRRLSRQLGNYRQDRRIVNMNTDSRVRAQDREFNVEMGEVEERVGRNLIDFCLSHFAIFEDNGPGTCCYDKTKCTLEIIFAFLLAIVVIIIGGLLNSKRED